jgi:hypothetical protein
MSLRENFTYLIVINNVLTKHLAYLQVPQKV